MLSILRRIRLARILNICAHIGTKTDSDVFESRHPDIKRGPRRPERTPTYLGRPLIGLIPGQKLGLLSSGHDQGVLTKQLNALSRHVYMCSF